MRKKNVIRALRALGLFLGMAATAVYGAGYYTQDGRIFDASGQRIQIRGINHFGFNADVLAPQFLWAMGWKQQIAQIKELGFNAVRLPITPDTLYVTTPVEALGSIDAGKNPELIGKTPLQVLDLWMAEADRQGLYVMIDMHSITNDRLNMTWFTNSPADVAAMWNGQPYTEDDWVRDLKFVAQRYAHLPRFFALDLYNEPNGIVRWSVGDPNTSDPKYHWKRAAEKAAAAVLAVNPQILIFVEGINGNYDGIENSNIPMNWAEDFQPHAYQPLNIPYDKLVLSPHTYGPDVYMKSSFNASNFPANLAADWEILFGQFFPLHPVVPGEWGGRYGTGHPKDVAWQNAFVDYMLSKGMSDSFYWCYTPNSHDTGGILDDNLNVREDKMQLLRRLWAGSGVTPTPAPTTTPAPTSTPAPTATPAPTPTPTPVPTATPPASGYAQPYIAGFTPTSGAVGTVVTVNGNGYTGLSRVTVGGVDAAFQVSSDTRLTLTVPTGAVSGQVALFNPQRAAWSGGVFTVTGGSSTPTPAPTPTPTATPPPTADYAQPYINNFSPRKGNPGTVVTINGNGFTGLTRASIGSSTATFEVLSDTRVRVRIPAGASSAQIALFNPKHAVWTPTRFIVK